MRYKNPYHDPWKHYLGPEYYESNARPTKYGGYLIIRRLPQVWDIVKDGECVGQMAGKKKKKRAIDNLNKE